MTDEAFLHEPPGSSANLPQPRGAHGYFSDTFDADIAHTICERIADGESLKKICKEPGMPCRLTAQRWLGTHAEFWQEYCVARVIRIDDMVDEIIEIADDKSKDHILSDGNGEEAVPMVIEDKTAIARSLMQINARKMLLSMCLPQRYGAENPSGLALPAEEIAPEGEGEGAKDVGGNVILLDGHPLRDEIEAWNKAASAARKQP